MAQSSKLRTEGLQSARDFDATKLRQYPPDKPVATQSKERAGRNSPGKSMGSSTSDGDWLAKRMTGDLKIDDGEGEVSWEDLADSVQPAPAEKKSTGNPPSRPGHSSAASKRAAAALEAGGDDAVALECSGFPASWKTYHLEDAFSDGGADRDSFRIKWINDTSALIIFGSTSAAKQAYATVCTNPFFKVTLFKGKLEGPGPAVNEARPVTSDVVARRLISGALGIAVKKRTPEERAAEDAKLKEAQAQRERAAQARKQRELDLAAAFDDS
jgi:hypothetical protein